MPNKVELDDVLASYAGVARFNANFDLIEDGFQNTLSRDGTSPNAMEANLDMNGFEIVNLGPLTIAEFEAENPDYTFVVTTLAPGADATLDITGTYPDLTLTFGLPRGLPGAGVLGDANYGDITVSGSGTVMAINANSVALANLVAAGSAGFVGATGAGDYEHRTAAQVKLDLSLENVNNTSDANKPVSTATQTALDALDTRLDVVETTIPQTAGTAGRALVLTDAGKTIPATGNMSIPANATVAFPIGSVVEIYNNSAGNIQISITTDTLRLVGTATTGTRTLAQRGLAVLKKVNTTEWIAGGVT